MAEEETIFASDEVLHSAPVSKSEYVFRRLREELRSGAIPPGAQIIQTEVGKRYGVSATPVREALRRLEADGYINNSPHRGTTAVTEMSRHNVHDLYLFRIAVESMTARLAAERGAADDFARIRALHEELIQASTTESAPGLSQRNRDFHLAIMRVGSPFIADQIMRPLWERTNPVSASLWVDPRFVRQCLKEHGRVVAAIEKGDLDRAGAAMAAHIQAAAAIREKRSKQPPVERDAVT